MDSSFKNVVDATGGYAHFAQILFYGDRAAYLKSVGASTDLMAYSDMSSDQLNQVNQQAQDYANSFCQGKYRSMGSQYVSACAGTVITALMFTNGWNPSYYISSPS